MSLGAEDAAVVRILPGITVEDAVCVFCLCVCRSRCLCLCICLFVFCVQWYTMAVDAVSQMLSGVTNTVSQQADYPLAVIRRRMLFFLF